MQRNYRTQKGTELPLLNLRGREYLEVKYRLVWFREDHPSWAIETELLSVTEDTAYARATIKDETGRTIATSHKFESKQNFADFIEKAETGAIGRALALIGYGTQFCADELDEGDRIVDAPVRVSEPWPDQPLGRESAIPRESDFLGSQDADSESGSGPAISAEDPGEYRVGFGRRFKGLRLKEIPRNELEGYVDWLEINSARKGNRFPKKRVFSR